MNDQVIPVQFSAIEDHKLQTDVSVTLSKCSMRLSISMICAKSRYIC